MLSGYDLLKGPLRGLVKKVRELEPDKLAILIVA